MDFSGVLDRIASFLRERRQPFALVGGVALAAYGIARTTLDLDLAVDVSAQEAIVAFMESQGYATLHRSAGFSNHLHADPDLGRVDFLYVRDETSRRLFAELRHVAGPRGASIPVPKPEHLAAMKVQAMKDDPARTFQELADVRALLARPDLDRAEVRGYFERHGLLDRYDELLATL
jgi:hypothetical protein